MTWNYYLPTPQCSNALPYTFQLEPPLLNLGIPGTLYICKSYQLDHATYTTVGFILFIMLDDHNKESLPMQEISKLGAYQNR